MRTKFLLSVLLIAVVSTTHAGFFLRSSSSSSSSSSKSNKFEVPEEPEIHLDTGVEDLPTVFSFDIENQDQDESSTSSKSSQDDGAAAVEVFNAAVDGCGNCLSGCADCAVGTAKLVCHPVAIVAYVVAGVITGAIMLALKQDALTCSHYVGTEGIVMTHNIEQKFGLVDVWELKKDDEVIGRIVQDNVIFQSYSIQKALKNGEFAQVGALDQKYFDWDSRLDYDCEWPSGEYGNIEFTFFDHRAKLKRGDDTLQSDESYYNRAYAFFNNPKLSFTDKKNGITTVIVKKLSWTNKFEICTSTTEDVAEDVVENNLLDMSTVAVPFQKIIDEEAKENEAKNSKNDDDDFFN